MTDIRVYMYTDMGWSIKSTLACASQLGAPAAEQATAFHSSSLLNKRRQARRIHSKAAKGAMNEPAIAAAALLVLQ